MQDRFKFRFWCEKDKTMYYVNSNNCIFTKQRRLNLSSVFNNESDRYIPLQCTGLKDKNGKLIYEGDIVKVSGYGVEGIYKMFWDDVTACFCTSIYESDCFEHSQSVMEVIGNIYESKDIMYYG